MIDESDNDRVTGNNDRNITFFNFFNNRLLYRQASLVVVAACEAMAGRQVGIFKAGLADFRVRQIQETNPIPFYSQESESSRDKKSFSPTDKEARAWTSKAMPFSVHWATRSP